MNEIQVIQQQLRLEQVHFIEVAEACRSALDQGSWRADGELGAALSAYFAVAVHRVGAAVSIPGASAGEDQWREFLKVFGHESQRYFASVEALAGLGRPVTQWRALSRMDADSVMSEREAYRRVTAVLSP